MERQNIRKHNIDSIFLMVVFLLFTFASVMIMLLSIRSYRAIVDNGEKDASARAAMSYVREIVHQNDRGSAINVSTFDGQPCIKIYQTAEYLIYIYEYEGVLKELYTKEGAMVNLSDGTDIMRVKEFDIYTESENILKISCVDEYDQRAEVIVNLKSSGDAFSVEEEPVYEEN